MTEHELDHQIANALKQLSDVKTRLHALHSEFVNLADKLYFGRIWLSVNFGPRTVKRTDHDQTD